MVIRLLCQYRYTSIRTGLPRRVGFPDEKGKQEGEDEVPGAADLLLPQRRSVRFADTLHPHETLGGC